MRTLLAASGGGHLTQLVRLRDRLPFDPGEVTWFTMDSLQSRSMLAGERVVFAHPAPSRDWRAALRNARLADALMRRFRFDVAVSTGASLAVSTLPIARRRGVEAYFIESAARVAGPSMTGRMLARWPGVRTFCQYRSWASERWYFAGSVFDGFESCARRASPRVDRVVVALGSQSYPFDRLVTRLVEALPTGVEVLWQTGATDPRIHGIDGHRYVAADDLETAMADADVVVTHAGVGSALSALSAGRHPVLIPRRVSRGEHVDDHQEQIAVELHRRGLAATCDADELDLGVLMAASRLGVAQRTSCPDLDLASGGGSTVHRPLEEPDRSSVLSGYRTGITRGDSRGPSQRTGPVILSVCIARRSGPTRSPLWIREVGAFGRSR